MLDMEWISKLYKKLETARLERKAVTPYSAEDDAFDLADGYAVQRMGLEAALAKGQRVAGYKMGLTSRAKQRDVNVFEPIRGFLLSTMETIKGGQVDTSTRIHPRVEPEVAVVLKKPLAGPGVGLRDVLDAIGDIYPALEILDSRYQSFQFRLADVVADNTSASGFMVGRTSLLPRLHELNLLGITLRKNGEIVDTGAPAATLGDPLLPVVSLANALGREGLAIEPGMVLLTGGVCTSTPFQAGDRIECDWPGETLYFQAI